MRLLYRYTLLPGNIERCQWVNRYYRSKVLLNVAGFGIPKLYSAKAQRVIGNILFLNPSLGGTVFLMYLELLKGVNGMDCDAGGSSHLRCFALFRVLFAMPFGWPDTV